MSGDAKILKEYLLSLGFKIDETQGKKFDLAILRHQLGVGGLAKGVLGVATAVQAMVAVYATSMEKLYYSSRRAESSAGSLKAMQFAAKAVGVDGAVMVQSLEGMARAMRLNPGLQGLLETLGISVTGRDKADVMMDMLKALKAMPFEIGAQYAGLFGIDSDSYLLLTESLEKFREAAELRKQMALSAGVDADQAAKASVEYANILRSLEARVGLLKDAFLIELLPSAIKFAKALESGLGAFTRWMTSGGMKADAKVVQDAPANASSFLGKYWEYTKWFWEGRKGASPFSQVSPPKTDPRGEFAAVQGDPQSLFNLLEQKMGLPLGLLDKVWLQESSRGRNMLSRAGAKGHFGFMDATAKEQGLRDPNNLEQSAAAAARYLSQLMQKYGGDLQMTLAAYNWGMGNLDRNGLANAPWETRKYVQDVTGRPITIEQKTDIHIASSDPAQAGREVRREMDHVNADLLRNFSGAVR